MMMRMGANCAAYVGEACVYNERILVSSAPYKLTNTFKVFFAEEKEAMSCTILSGDLIEYDCTLTEVLTIAGNA